MGVQPRQMWEEWEYSPDRCGKTVGVQPRQMREESGSTVQTDVGREWEYNPDR